MTTINSTTINTLSPSVALEALKTGSGRELAALIRIIVGNGSQFDPTVLDHWKFSIVPNESFPMYGINAYYTTGENIKRHITWRVEYDALKLGVGIGMLRDKESRACGAIITVKVEQERFGSVFLNYEIESPALERDEDGEILENPFSFIKNVGEMTFLNLTALLRRLETIEESEAAFFEENCRDERFQFFQCREGEHAQVFDTYATVWHYRQKSMAFRNRFVMRLMLSELGAKYTIFDAVFAGWLDADGHCNKVWADHTGLRLVDYPNARWEVGTLIIDEDNLAVRHYPDGTLLAVVIKNREPHIAAFFDEKRASRLIYNEGEGATNLADRIQKAVSNAVAARNGSDE